MKDMTTRGRHPHQVMDVDDLVVGKNYAIVRDDYGTKWMSPRRMAGRLLDHPRHRCAPPFTALFVGPPDKRSFTVHPNGWPYLYGQSGMRDPVLVYWDGDRWNGWEYFDFFSGAGDGCIVRLDRWLDDPEIRAATPSGAYAAPAAEFEAEMRRRKDEVMRRRHGF